MKRILWVVFLLALTRLGLAQVDTPTADHSHTYEGQALIFSPNEHEIIVALGTDGLVDHLFRFTHAEPYFISDEPSPSTVYYSHDRLVVATERATYIFSIEKGRKKLNDFQGSGLSHVYDLTVAIELSEAGVTEYLSAVQESVGNAPQPKTRPPPTPGPGGGGCPSSCSYTCANGSITVNCTSPQVPCARCICFGGNPFGTCDPLPPQ